MRLMKLFFTRLAVLSMIVSTLFVATSGIGYAQNNPQGRSMLDTIAEDSGLIEDAGGVPTLQQRIGQIINPVLGLVGSIFLGLMVYAGLMWMMAAGNEQKVETARQIIRWAIFGLVATVLSYALVTIIATALTNRPVTGQ